MIWKKPVSTRIPEWMVPYCPGGVIVEDRRWGKTIYYCVGWDKHIPKG